MEMWAKHVDDGIGNNNAQEAFTLAQFRAKRQLVAEAPAAAGQHGRSGRVCSGGALGLLPGLQSLWDAAQRDGVQIVAHVSPVGRLVAHHVLPKLRLQVRRGPADEAHDSDLKYWGGYWWRIRIMKEQDGCAGIFLMATMSISGGNVDCNKPKALTNGIQVRHPSIGLAAQQLLLALAPLLAMCTNHVRPTHVCQTLLQIHYGVCVDGRGMSWRMESTEWFQPSKGSGWGRDNEHEGQPVAWCEFWAPGSPWLVNGKACVRFTLKAA